MVGLDDLRGVFPPLGFSHSLVALWDIQQDKGYMKLIPLAIVEPLTRPVGQSSLL